MFVVVWHVSAWPPEVALVVILECAIYSLTANQIVSMLTLYATILQDFNFSEFVVVLKKNAVEAGSSACCYPNPPYISYYDVNGIKASILSRIVLFFSKLKFMPSE